MWVIRITDALTDKTYFAKSWASVLDRLAKLPPNVQGDFTIRFDDTICPPIRKTQAA